MAPILGEYARRRLKRAPCLIASHSATDAQAVISVSPNDEIRDEEANPADREDEEEETAEATRRNRKAPKDTTVVGISHVDNESSDSAVKQALNSFFEGNSK